MYRKIINNWTKIEGRERGNMDQCPQFYTRLFFLPDDEFIDMVYFTPLFPENPVVDRKYAQRWRERWRGDRWVDLIDTQRSIVKKKKNQTLNKTRHDRTKYNRKIN